MPTYEELEREPYWGQEKTAPAHEAFNERIRKALGLSRVNCGSKGDNHHLRGRHRSGDWSLHSRYCTNRAYGTSDVRDKTGDPDWLTATDIVKGGAWLQAAARRVDTAVRAGRLPCLAEWFATFDGVHVAGWFQGGPATSDSSHLWHFHLGLWRSHANNAGQLQLLGDIVLGVTSPTTPKPADPHPVGTRELIYRGGDSWLYGNDVRYVQRRVGAGVDGYYGEQSVAKVKAWQRSHGGLAPDGIVGRRTWAALGVHVTF